MLDDFFEVTKAYANTRILIPKSSVISIAEVHDNDKIKTCLTVKKIYMYLDSVAYKESEYVVEQLNISNAYDAIKFKLGILGAKKCHDEDE